MAKKNILIQSKLRKAEKYLQENRLYEAILIFQGLSKQDGANSGIWSQLSILYRKCNDYTQAEICARKAIEISPYSPLGLLALGAVLHSQHKLKEAVIYYKKAQKLQPDNIDVNYYLANALRELGELDAAVVAYSTLLQYEPKHFEGLNNYGALLTNLERADEAIVILQKALNIDKDCVETLVNLARANTLVGNPDLAINFLERALKRRPDFYDAHLELGQAYRMKGENEKAIRSYKRAQQIRPGSRKALIGEAKIYEILGKYDDASAILGPLIGAGESSDALPAFFDISSKINQRRKAVSLIHSALEKPDINLAATAPLHFRLGKYYDQEGMYADAINHFVKANILKRRQYDIEITEKEFLKIRGVYDHEFVETMATSSSPADLLVFIVGMPRSGTSLIEQIMASHPKVYGAGETDSVKSISDVLSSRYSGDKYPGYIPRLSVNSLKRASEDLLDLYRERTPDVVRVTDKMPQNFLYIGFILQLLPNCHIIHCTRNPLDTCLSCYFSEFGSDYHKYTYDLYTLGRYYSLYVQLMEHWGNIFPGRIHNVIYEDLVADQEAVSKGIFNYCEVEWSESCLEFYKTDRVINTISYDQVRQPIYKSSVSRWRNYDKYLNPLREVLDEYGVQY